MLKASFDGGGNRERSRRLDAQRGRKKGDCWWLGEYREEGAVLKKRLVFRREIADGEVKGIEFAQINKHSTLVIEKFYRTLLNSITQCNLI